MDPFLPDPKQAAKVLSKWKAAKAKEQQVFADSVDIEKMYPTVRRICIVCNRKRSEKEMHRFTDNVKKRKDWINALRSTPDGRRSLSAMLNGSKNPFLCSSHFRPSDYINSVLRPDAVPFHNEATVTPTTATSATVAIATAPQPTWTPHTSPLHPSSSLYRAVVPSPSLAVVPSSSVAVVPLRRSIRPLPLLDLPLPPCCECCCRPEQEKDLQEDPDWTPKPATIGGSTLSEYQVVSSDSLLSLLRQCTSCIGGERSLIPRMEGMAMTCTGKCNQCGAPFTWSSSRKLPTAKESNYERLFKINVDITTGSILSSIGGTKLQQFLLTSGIASLTPPTYHLMKKFYVIPAVNEFFFNSQASIIDGIRERIARGGKIHLCGDGSFDSRGYSASWCRYFLLDAETGVALHYALVHKSETGSSGTMEVAALEMALNELSYMIGGIEGIESVVTDRHGSVIKMMKSKFSGIKHYFDPWHFIRNITLSLISICKAQYMTPVRMWVKPIINRCYDAILTAQGNGELAAEKFRATLLCMQGQHECYTLEPPQADDP